MIAKGSHLSLSRQGVSSADPGTRGDYDTGHHNVVILSESRPVPSSSRTTSHLVYFLFIPLYGVSSISCRHLKKKKR